MLVLGLIYHYLMNRYPDGGGTYTYTKELFGYDHAFVSAWFLILTYIAIIWANATALPLIARTLLGSTFQFGFDYEIAGFHVYFGEILLAVGSLVLAALVCLRRKAAAGTQVVMAVLLFAGVVICFTVAALRTDVAEPFNPPFSRQQGAFNGTFTVFALAPWAYVGFESITHSAGESRYPLKRSFGIMAVALVAAGIAYAVLNLLAVTALPEGIGSWVEYTDRLGEQTGLASQPTFFAAHSAMGTAGSIPVDMTDVLSLMENHKINPGAMVSHILGLKAVESTLYAMEKPSGAKKVCYNELDIPLVAIADLAELGKTDPMYAELAVIVERNGGMWCAEAEQYLLANAPRL
jgi:amino acid transporter